MASDNPTLRVAAAAAIANLPAYYPLYALYADYQINNVEHARLEDLERVRESLRVIAPLVGKEQPYRKDWALRLFTEREALSQFPVEKVNEAWRQLRQAIGRIGPPPNFRPRKERPAARGKPARAASAKPAAPKKPRRAFPKSPVDYSGTV